MPSFYEFFSGGGMARLGLGNNWECKFANDICPKKVATYSENFGNKEILCEDIYNLTVAELPENADLIWGSFPCQDLSLAGNGAGLNGQRSGTFNKLIELISDLKKESRTPKIVVLENVVGAITSNQGKDFTAMVGSLVDLGYRVGCTVIDGASFVPQSRPRLFFIATQLPKKKLAKLSTKAPTPYWHPENLVSAQSNLPSSYKRKWVWWKIPIPSGRTVDLVDIIEDNQTDVEAYSKSKTLSLLAMMSDINLRKIDNAKKAKTLKIGGLYKRTRKQKDGSRKQRAEVRFDGITGCLRTPTGGSSRQTILLVNGENITARLLSRREAARLMGVPENYKIPKKYNDAYHVFGDGLVVPVVSWIEQHLLRPLIEID